MQNTTTTGTYYVQGNNTPISNNILVNCQQVEYSSDYVYVTATGIPAYTTGPFLDGNPSLAQNQNAIYKFSLNPYTLTNNLSINDESKDIVCLSSSSDSKDSYEPQWYFLPKL